MSDEADRLIAAALRDHARVPAPASLRRKLERQLRPAPRRWIAPLASAVAAAAAAAVIVLALRPAPSSSAPDVATEAVGDHLRVLVGRGLGVEASDMHQVKPWFAGKLDFVPPIAFLGDDEFPLKGGDVAVFLGHKAAAVVYGRRLHVISLFVFQATDVPEGERTIAGFHALTWGHDGFGFALVSDVNWDDLHTLASRIR